MIYKNKILLVDDNVKNLQIAMNILKDYKVIFAQSGQKALELVKENDFDLILLDVVMPELNGYEVCKILKEDVKTKDIPIIFLTVKDEEKDIIEGFELGAVDYITKPFSSYIFLKRVQLHLKLANTRKDLENTNKHLNEQVQEQVKELRKKDEMLILQSKLDVMDNIIDIVYSKWKQPSNMIKMYLQSMNLQNKSEELKYAFNKIQDEISTLDERMENFKKFFKNDLKKEKVCLKVLIENILFSLRKEINKNNVSINIKGNHLSKIYVVLEEIEHIITKLIQNVLTNFCPKEKEIFIDFDIKESDKDITLDYKVNTGKNEDISLFFDVHTSLESNNFDLGCYLVKLFVDKNNGKIIFENSHEGIDLKIVFNK